MVRTRLEYRIHAVLRKYGFGGNFRGGGISIGISEAANTICLNRSRNHKQAVCIDTE